MPIKLDQLESKYQADIAIPSPTPGFKAPTPIAMLERTPAPILAVSSGVVSK
jgi:hypothetical protein